MASFTCCCYSLLQGFTQNLYFVCYYVLLEMSCLIDALDDKNVNLKPDCRKALQDRVALWNKAVQVNEVFSFSLCFVFEYYFLD